MKEESDGGSTHYALQGQQNSYINLLETLNELKSAAKDDPLLLEHLPKLVVIGEESVGKSFLLQCLTNILFPTDATTCTRVPIWVECRKSDQTSYCMQVKNGSFQHFDTREDLMEAIREEQNRILSGGLKFSQTPISIRVTSEDHMDITVVDLPGIKQSGDGVNDTRELVEKYYSNPLTLALTVQTINTTDGNNTFHDYVKKYDPRGKRTLKIITKCDVIGTEDLKLNACRVLNDQEFPTHAVVCAPHGSMYSGAFEDNTFDKFTRLTTTSRMKCTGIPALRDRMVERFSNLLADTIPDMSRKYHVLLSKLSMEVHQLGETPPNVHDVRTSMVHVLRMHATVSLEEEITKLCQEFQASVAAAQLQCVRHKDSVAPFDENLSHLPIIYTDENFQLTQFSPSFFQGERLFERCIYRIVQDVWGWLARDLQSKISTTFHSGDFIADLLTANKFPDALQQCVLHRWVVLWSDANSKFYNKLGLWLEENSRFSESNHVFEAEVRNNLLVCPDELQWKFVNTFAEINFNDHDSKHLKQKFSDCVTSYIEETMATPDVPQRRLLHDMVQACYTSKSKALQIAVTALTRTCFLDTFDSWLDELRGDAALLRHSRENEERRLERKILLKRQKRLKKCLAVMSGMTQDPENVSSGRVNNSYEVV
eukprot:Lankesteria_metandrocarpae@DN2693_c0_g1_i1.p1